MKNSVKRKIISLSVVVALAATLVIGGTLAYFNDTKNVENVFTFGKGVSVELKEGSDPKDIPGYKENDPKYKGGTSLGEGKGYKYEVAPGCVYAKQVGAVLTGDKVHLYMELTMDSVKYDALVAALGGADKLSTMVIWPNSVVTPPQIVAYTNVVDKGVQKSKVVFYYGEKAEGEHKLMSAVQIPDTFTDADMQAIKNAGGAGNENVNLDVAIYAVQADGVTESVARDVFFSDYTKAN